MLTFFPDFLEEPLPHPDVSLLATQPSTYVSDPSIRTISVDVMSILGNAATPIQESAVFYDTEIVVIIHRKKSTSSGLVATTVWAWQGKNSRLDEGEKSKLTEIASRYGTSYVRPFLMLLRLVLTLLCRFLFRNMLSPWSFSVCWVVNWRYVRSVYLCCK